MRLNRYLAAAGQGSRRSCEELILSGVVSVNGVVCTTLSTQIGPDDVVKVRNKVMQVARPFTLLLHKPPGFLCTASDTHERRTIFDLLPKNFPRVFHVGRLDMESEGLLIMTNDGELALQLTHPRYKVAKEYEVVLNHPFDFTLSPKMIRGISTPEGMARAITVHRLGNNKAKVVLRQGLKRQIRHMFYALGYEVVKLTRTRIGPITMQNMPPGSWRELTQREIQSLLASRAEEAPRPPKQKQEGGRPGESTRPAPRPAAPSPPSNEEEEEATVWAGEWEGDWEKEWAAFEGISDDASESDERDTRTERAPRQPRPPRQPHQSPFKGGKGSKGPSSDGPRRPFRKAGPASGRDSRPSQGFRKDEAPRKGRYGSEESTRPERSGPAARSGGSFPAKGGQRFRGERSGERERDSRGFREEAHESRRPLSRGAKKPFSGGGPRAFGEQQRKGGHFSKAKGPRRSR